MMKHRNLLSFFGVFFMTAFLLTSCSSNDDDDYDDYSGSSSIVGEWAFVEYGSNGRWMYMEVVNFKRNGSFTSVNYYVEGRNLSSDNAKVSSVEKEKTSGTYTTSSGVITLTADGDTWDRDYSVKSDRLIVYNDEGNIYYEVMTDEIEDLLDQVEQWYRLQNNEPANNDNNDDDDPIWEGDSQDTYGLVGDWVAMEVRSNGRYIEMEKVTFKSNGTYTVVQYAIHGKNLDSNGTVEQVDIMEGGGKYRATDGALTLNSSEGKSSSVLFKINETSLMLYNGEISITYQRMIGDLKTFVEMVELIYQNQQ